MTTFHERSAGVIPYRRGDDQGPLYLVLHSATVRNPRAKWEFPKGGVEPGESTREAAAQRIPRGDLAGRLVVPRWLRTQPLLHLHPPRPQDRQDGDLLPRRGPRRLVPRPLAPSTCRTLPDTGTAGAPSTRSAPCSITARSARSSPRPTNGSRRPTMRPLPASTSTLQPITRRSRTDFSRRLRTLVAANSVFLPRGQAQQGRSSRSQEATPVPIGWCEAPMDPSSSP